MWIFFCLRFSFSLYCKSWNDSSKIFRNKTLSKLNNQYTLYKISFINFVFVDKTNTSLNYNLAYFFQYFWIDERPSETFFKRRESSLSPFGYSLQAFFPYSSQSLSKLSPQAAMHLLYHSNNFWNAQWNSSCVIVSMTFVTASFISSIVS